MVFSEISYLIHTAVDKWHFSVDNYWFRGINLSIFISFLWMIEWINSHKSNLYPQCCWYMSFARNFPA